MRILKDILLSIFIFLAGAGLFCITFFSQNEYASVFVSAFIIPVLISIFAVVLIFIVDSGKPLLFAFLYTAALLCGLLIPFIITLRKYSSSLFAFACFALIVILADLFFICARLIKGFSKYKSALRKSPGAGLFGHIISFIVTILCALTLCFIVNFRLYLLCKEDLALIRLEIPAQSFEFLFKGSENLLTVICIIFILVLLITNALIYRRSVKKIFEHYSIVFTGTGGISLLFASAFSYCLPYLIVSGILLLTGAILMLFYIIAYHAQALKSNDRQKTH